MNTQNQLLYGKDNQEGIVGAHLHGADEMKLYVRESESVRSEVHPFRPFLFLTEEANKLFTEKGYSKWTKELSGGAAYQYLRVFEGWHEMRDARKYIAGETSWQDVHAPSSPVAQFLMQTGKTFFKGISFGDVRRLQLDIETYTEEGFPNAQRLEDEITIISLTDSWGFERVIYQEREGLSQRFNEKPFEAQPDEAALLRSFIKWLHRLDPDVLELHNGFGFDLPYIRDRCELHEIPFALGRDNSVPRSWDSEREFGGKSFDYERFQVAGRSIIDTFFLAAQYDVYARDLPGLGLKDVAKHFGVAPEDRTYVEGDQITEVWRENPERLLEYALDDVIETRGVANELSASVFKLAEILPLGYQGAHLAGTASSIQALMLRGYLDERASVPQPGAGQPPAGGYTDIFQRGAFKNGENGFMYADVASLYPSIMLNYDCVPRSDHLGLFKRLLETLTDLRLEAKAELKTLEGQEWKRKDSEQAAYKILINSFYGMLGFKYGLFNDLGEADRITRTGRALLRRMIEVIEEQVEGSCILADTDGVLFELPHAGMTDAEVDEIASFISSRMPQGIEVDNDGRFNRVLAYRKKNYVLEEPDGTIKFKGGSFKGRNQERFGVDYVKDIAQALLRQDVAEVGAIHRRTKRRILTRDWDVEDFMKRATLKDSLEVYQESLNENPNKHPQAQYELALERQQETGKEFLPGDRVNYFIAGSKPKSRITAYKEAQMADRWKVGAENTNYYFGVRLKKFAEKFEPFFTEEGFARLFNMSQNATQPTLFAEPSYADVEILRERVKKPDF